MAAVRDGLRSAGISVWTDANLTPGTPAWEAAIQEAIENCTRFIVLLSPQAKESKWVNLEIAYADDHDKVIIPVVISDKEKESVPLRLGRHQRVSLVGADLNQFIHDLAQAIPQAENTPIAPAPPPKPRAPKKSTSQKRTPKPSESAETSAPAPAATPPPVEADPPPAPPASLQLGGVVPTSRLQPVQTKPTPSLLSPNYNDFLSRYKIDQEAVAKRRQASQAKYEKEQQEERKREEQEYQKASEQLVALRQTLPDSPPLQAGNPLDQLRLLWWLFVEPNQAFIFKHKAALKDRWKIGGWLVATLTYLMMLIFSGQALLNQLPLQDVIGIPPFVILLTLTAFWFITPLWLIEDHDMDRVVYGLLVMITAVLLLLVGGAAFLVIGLVAGGISLWVMYLQSNFEADERISRDTILLSILGAAILGIVGRLEYRALLDDTLPLTQIGLVPGCLMLAAFSSIAGLIGNLLDCDPFHIQLGEEKESTRNNSQRDLYGHSGMKFIIGLGVIIIIVVALALGSGLASESYQGVAKWIGTRLPFDLWQQAPNLEVPIGDPHWHLQFKFAEVFEGFLFGEIALFGTALIALMMILPFVPAIFIGEKVLSQNKDSRADRNSQGYWVVGLLIFSYLLLIIAPFLG